MTIISVMPADGWHAVFVGDTSTTWRPLVCWTLVWKPDLGTHHIVGMAAHRDEVVPVTALEGFAGYVPAIEAAAHLMAE